MKKCKKCKETKNSSEFYKNKRAKDGLYIYCKECHKNIQKEYQKKYHKTTKYKEYQDKYQKKYCKKDKYKKNRRKYHNKYNKKTTKDERKKYLCRQLTNLAIRKGELVKPKFCEEYIKTEESCSDKIQAHHEDYDKPLEVNWLCKKHHTKLHTN